MSEITPPPAEPLRRRGGRHQNLGYYGRPGIYVLHFDRPTLLPGGDRRLLQNGDALHYVGQAEDVTARLRQHRAAWEQRSRKGAARLAHAGRDGVDYHCSRFLDEPDRVQRLAIEAQWQREPHVHCTTCREQP